MIVIAAATVRLSSQHVCNVELPFVTEKQDSSHLPLDVPIQGRGEAYTAEVFLDGQSNTNGPESQRVSRGTAHCSSCIGHEVRRTVDLDVVCITNAVVYKLANSSSAVRGDIH